MVVVRRRGHLHREDDLPQLGSLSLLFLPPPSLPQSDQPHGPVLSAQIMCPDGQTTPMLCEQFDIQLRQNLRRHILLRSSTGRLPHRLKFRSFVNHHPYPRDDHLRSHSHRRHPLWTKSQSRFRLL